MQAISDNLIHFLGRQYKGSPNEQLGIFKYIIHRGLRFGKISIRFGDKGFVDNYAVCFTDIPLSLCDEHAAVYGKFGIGFRKSSIKKCGGHPVRYFINYSPVESRDKTLVDCRGSLHDLLSSQFGFVTRLKNALEDDTNFALYGQQGKVMFDHLDSGTLGHFGANYMQ